MGFYHGVYWKMSESHVGSSSSNYGEEIKRVRIFFRDGKPHSPREAVDLGSHVRHTIFKLFYRGFLLRTRDLMNYDYVEVHGNKAKWCRIRGYMYIWRQSKLLESNNAVKWKLKRTERLTMKTSLENVTLLFISYEKSRTLQTDHYKHVVSQKNVLEYFEKRGIGAPLKIISADMCVDASLLGKCISTMVRTGKLAKKGKWNPAFGRETIFRGRLHGYVYGLTPEQCERFIKSGEVLSAEANAILKEVIKNSNEKRLTPTHMFINSPYNFDPASTKYHSEVLINAFKNIGKVSSVTGLVFLYDKEKLTEEDIKRQTEYWDRRLSEKKSLTYVVGEMHEKIVQMGLDSMKEDLNFGWRFLSVVRSGRISFQIRISNGHEIDRILLISINPFGVEHQYPIEAKYQRVGVTIADVFQFYDNLRNSQEYGCSIEYPYDGKEIRILKFNVTPVLVTPKITDDARKWALSHGMMVLPTWKITQYYRDKHGLKNIRIKELAMEFLNRTNKHQTMDEFLHNKLEVGK